MSVTVNRGAEFLDENYPGWAGLIDTDALDIGDSCGCVLGQLYLREHPRIRKEGSKTLAFYRKANELGFGSGHGALGVDWTLARAHGFSSGRGKISNLTAAWVRAIQKRQVTA